MMNKEIRGVPLHDDDLREGKVLFTDWHGKIAYAWDTGITIGKFLAELKNGKIFGRKCNLCGRIMIPPRIFCELCFCRTNEWVELSDTGKVNTFSVSFVNWDASRREKPQIPAVVEIDGASEGMGIMHLLGEVGDTLQEVLSRVKVGLKVKAVWKPAEQRQGSITDILYFRPVE